MSSGRRGLVLSVAFFGLVIGLSTGRTVHAQPNRFQPFQPPDNGPGRHSIWQQQLTPEQIRELLARFGQDDGKNDWFEKMIFDAVKEKNPNVKDAQVKETIKRLMSDKDFMERMTDIAQKNKNQLPNNVNGGKGPQFTPNDIAELEKRWRDAHNGGDPFKVPPRQVDPRIPPFDPRHPDFDGKKWPLIDKDTKFDPETKFPLHPETGRPIHPVTGNEIDPKNPPKDLPPVPKVNPNDPNTRPDNLGPPKVGPMGEPPPPKFDPFGPNDDRTGKQPNNPDGNRKFDPENPFGPAKESPEQAARTKAAETATALWEKNVGPIEESPGVKRAIIDLVSDQEAMEALTDGKGHNIFDFLNGEGADGEKFGDLFGGGADGNWEWPKLDWDFGRGRGLDWDFGGGGGNNRPRPEWNTPRTPRDTGGPSIGGPSFNFGGTAVPLWPVLILLALVVAAVLYWKWKDIFQPRAAVAFAGGPGEWPIDPRAINTREDVVKAFEYLSVLICGPGAKTWTHSTIAEELAALVATHGETAIKLARLYELARYAPLDEPLTRAELLEARRLVCDLAGMDEV